MQNTTANNFKLFITLLVIILSCIYMYYWIYVPYKFNISKNNVDFNKLVTEWNNGNVISLIRHNERCDRSTNQCLEGTKGITLNGKDKAITLGYNFRLALPINNSLIFSTQTLRTRQTAMYAFRDYAKAIRILDEKCTDSISECILNLKNKNKNKNLILVVNHEYDDALIKVSTNHPFLNKIHIDYGAAFFFQINNTTQEMSIMGMINQNEWKKTNKYKLS